MHNFIRLHDPDDNEPQTENNSATHDDPSDEVDPIATPEEPEEVDERRDRIAQAMWDDYQQVCEAREIGSDSDDDFDDDEVGL